MTLTNYLSFATAAAFLAIIPGPGILFVLAQTSKGGKSAGLSGALGTGIGGLIHVIAGALGLSAIVYSSALLFHIVKVAGSCYLFLLGWKALREKRSVSLATLSEISFQPDSLKQGIITESFNPKTALFFLALIPQFVNVSGNLAGQFLLLGTTSVILNTTADVLVVIFSDSLISRLRTSEFAASSFKYISSAGYFVLGLLSLRTSRQ